MDNIEYPRVLNRPTFIFWRFTHQDATQIGIVFVGTMIPKAFIPVFPQILSIGIPFAFVIYKGCVVALKPRGWDTHVVKSWFRPKQLNPGHGFQRCVVVETIQPKKERFSFFKSKKK